MVLVTGATGFVGAHLLFYLLGKEVKIKALYKNEASIEKVRFLFGLYHPNPDELIKRISWHKADITDITTLENVLDKIEKIYHLAAKVDFSSAQKDNIYQINVEGTKNLLNLALEYKIDKFFYMSSIAALGSYDQPVTEKTFWSWKEKGSYYAKTKYLAEMEVWRATQEGLNCIIVNPSVILGAWLSKQGPMRIFDKVYNGLKFYPPGSTGFIDVWDVVKLSYQLMESNRVNDSFILSAYNVYYKNLLDTIANTFHKKPPSIALKKWMIYPVMSLSNFFANIFKINILPEPEIIYSLFSTTEYSDKKLRKVLNVNYIPLDFTIKNICEKYLKFKKESINV